MVDYAIVPSEPRHLRLLCAALRQEDRKELTCLGFKPMVALRRSFRGALFRRSAFVDGEIAAMWGVQGSALGGVGQPWLLTTKAIERASLPFLREARREVAGFLDAFDRLENFVLADYTSAWRFMQLLGFTVSPPLPLGPKGTLFRRITLERAPPSYGAPFIVYAMPRSRTAWLAHFLAYGGREVYHDLPLAVASLGDLVATLSRPMTGSIETALARGAWIMREALPQARVAVIRRPIGEIQASASRIDWQLPDDYLAGEERLLQRIAAEPGTLALTYQDLDSEAGCRQLFEHCLGVPFDRAWWQARAAENIQLDPVVHRAYVAERQDSLNAIFREIEGRVRIECENFDSFYRDGQALFAEHYEEAGGFAELPFDPNIEMARAMEAAGQLVIVTARNAHGMVGYLVFLINQSFESRHVRLGFQNVFFVRRGWRGQFLGPKLHRAARAALKARGVTMLVMRSGVRAAGAKQRHLFARLGARDMGTLHYLPLDGIGKD